MLAHLIYLLRRLFTPHHTNNHRPKILHPNSLAVLALVVIGFNAGIGQIAGISGGILGYASNITETQVLEQTNLRRLEAGLQQFQLNNSLSDAARRKAADMFAFNYWAHTNPNNGTEPWFFFDAAGYNYRYAGENLARDFAATSPMVQAWIDSPTHRDNLLSTRYQDTGIAVVNGVLNGVETTLVVQLFGTKKQVAVVPQVSATSTGLPEVSESQNKVPSPIFSPFDVSKSLALATLFLISAVLIVDSVIIWRRKTHRLAGRNWAHLMFLIGLIGVVGTLSQGVIR